MTRLITALLLIALVAWGVPAGAQGNPPGDRVEITASDGLTLVGTYYAPDAPAASGTAAPAVLLMHHWDGVKEVWIDLVPALVRAGYAVLTVDLRGFGETGGDPDVVLMEQDAHLWLEWLRAQPGVDPDGVSITGSSTGADIGLRVMAEDERLVTLVGLSVLLDVNGILTKPAVEALGERPIYLVAAHGQPAEAEAIRELLAVAQGDIQVRLYEGSACCTFLFMLEHDLIPSIVSWLDVHTR